jgi:hypothetical protein
MVKGDPTMAPLEFAKVPTDCSRLFGPAMQYPGAKSSTCQLVTPLASFQ